MPSLVSSFQQDIVQASKSVTESLRAAKLISAKLGLPDIEAWIGHELNGYPDNEQVPSYRTGGGILQAFNPYQGWITVSDGATTMIFVQPITALEALCSQQTVHIQPPHPIPLSAPGFTGDSPASDFAQRIAVSGTTFKVIVEAVRDRLLDWSVELEKRGIVGENMSFDREEKESAQQQTFHIQNVIQNVTGVLGNITNSNVNVYNYTSIQQLLKEKKVPQKERNQLKKILNELKTSSPENRSSLKEKGKAWIVRNQEVLGAGANIIRTALGIPEVV
jgi:hypothetical protein